MLYFDTSFLAPLILPEATSGKIAAFVRELPAAQFTVSHWTRVEFSSLLAREVRMGELDADTAAQVDAKFEAVVVESFSVVLPNADDSVSRRNILVVLKLDFERATHFISPSPETIGRR